MIAVTTKAVFGDMETIKAWLSTSPAWNTSFGLFAPFITKPRRSHLNAKFGRCPRQRVKGPNCLITVKHTPTNFTLRQQNRRLTCKTGGFSKEMRWLEKQLWLSLPYYHLVLPHDSLRRRLDTPEPTRGTGSARHWCAIIPAMAAGMTDHVWNITELLSYGVPAVFLDSAHLLEQLFLPLEPIHQSN